MVLFNNIQHVKQFVGGAINVSLQAESIEPYVLQVMTSILRPKIGKILLNNLMVTPMLEVNDPLWDVVRRVVAPLAIEKYVPIGELQFSESGLQRVANDTHQTGFKYQVKAYRATLRESGYGALEEMLKYLDEHRSTYSQWNNAMHDAVLVRYATDMRESYGADIDREMYEILRGLLLGVEMSVTADLPLAFSIQLRGINVAGNANPYQAEALQLLKAGITELTISQAVDRTWVRWEGNRLVTLESDDQYSASKAVTATLQAATAKERHHSKWANRYLTAFKDYVFKNKTQFPTAFVVADGGTNTNTDAWSIAGKEQKVIDNKPYQGKSGAIL
jgi:hypothetical protein